MKHARHSLPFWPKVCARKPKNRSAKVRHRIEGAHAKQNEAENLHSHTSNSQHANRNTGGKIQAQHMQMKTMLTKCTPGHVKINGA